MKQYHDLLNRVLEQGESHDDRTGVGTISITGAMFQHDLRNGFPALTTKKLAWRMFTGELLWFIRGSTNVYELAEITYGDRTRRTIWTDNYTHQAQALGYIDGELGPATYGGSWRAFDGRQDQLQWVIDEIKKNPNSRRLIVSAWNPNEIDKYALPPCHVLYRFHVRGDTLGLTWYQRSVDTFLGLPANIASYALLLSIVAKITGYKPGLLTGMLDDVHIYKNHIDQVKEQLSREPRELPTLVVPDINHIDDVVKLTPADFVLTGYDPHPTISAPMAI